MFRRKKNILEGKIMTLQNCTISCTVRVNFTLFRLPLQNESVGVQKHCVHFSALYNGIPKGNIKQQLVNFSLYKKSHSSRPSGIINQVLDTLYELCSAIRDDILTPED